MIFKGIPNWRKELRKKRAKVATEMHRRRKISLALKGQRNSPNTEFKKGHKGYDSWSGKHHSPETRRKISKGHEGRKIPIETRKKISIALMGHPVSEETRRAMTGERNHGWKGGITPEHVKIRQSIEARLWREAVFARDNWTCQNCLERGGELNPHHIKNFSDYPELRCAIDNGVTLCEKCHRKFHRKYGRKNNTEEQVKEFLND